MNPDSVIFILSVQHTGTWFTIDLLRRHPDVGFFSLYFRLLQKYPHLEAVYQECSASLLGPNGEKVGEKPRPASADYDPRLLKQFIDVTLRSLPQTGRVLLHSHTQSPRRRVTGVCQGNLCATAFHGLFRTVVPMKDPLLSLLSRYTRNSELRNSNLVDDFEFVIESINPRCFFLPVDLFSDFEQRLGLLKQLLAFAGLSFQPYIVDIARQWTPRGTRGNYELKQWYERGSLAKIAKVIPEELAFLKSREAFIRPFLEELGYRNLLWWT